MRDSPLRPTVSPPRSPACACAPRGFTLVEMIVVVGIIAVMAALLIPAVHSARSSAQRTQCLNNLRQQVLAIHTFASAQRQFPAGRDDMSGEDLDTGWGLRLLPHLENSPLYERYDFRRPWSDAVNKAVADTQLPIFRCPSSKERCAGETDYGGISGSALTSTEIAVAFNNGVLVRVHPDNPRRVGFDDVRDGASQTIAVAERNDLPSPYGRWVGGLSAFGHEQGRVNQIPGHIGSVHLGGAHVGFLDGHTHFLSDLAPESIVGALCTRAHGESVDARHYH